MNSEMDELTQLSKQIARSKDIDFLNQHIAEDFVGIDPTGDRINKDRFLEFKTSAEQQEIPRTYDNYDVRLCAQGTIGILMFDATLYPGQDEEGYATFTQVYERIDGIWKAVSSQTLAYYPEQ